MKNYLILFVLLFIIYIIYNNKQHIKKSKINKKRKLKSKRKLKGGSFLDDFNTNEFLIKYIKTDSSDSNLYISRNVNNKNELVTINRNELLQTDPTVWKIEYNTSSNSYSINGKYGSLFADAEEPQYFIELNETNYNFKFKNYDSSVEKYLFVNSSNNLIGKENQGSLFKLEPYRLGLPIEINNKINIFSNVVDKMNTNQFVCEFKLNFNQIYFSELNNGSSRNFLTNKTEIFNIFILPDQIKNFNNKYNDKETQIKNYVNNSGSSQAIIFDKKEYILTNSSISDSIYKKNDIFKASETETNSRAENKFTFKYDISDNSFEIYTFDNNNSNNTGQLITKKLENNFVLYVNVNKTQHNIFLDNEELKISSDNFTTFKIINIIEKSTGYFCDIITKKDNGNIFSFSRNIKKVNNQNNPSKYNDVVDVSEVFRIELIRKNNKYKIKNLSDNKYLHLINDKLKWEEEEEGLKYANLFELNNTVDQNSYKFYLEKIASKNNTYKIKYEYLEQKKYLGCSKYKGKIVETDEKNASEFIIIPYEEEFIDNNKFDKIKNEFNIDSQTLLNKIENISLDINSKTFLEINDIYVNSSIKKELFIYLLFKIYYNKLNLSDSNEFNLEENSINKINKILNYIDKNIKNLQENYNGSYLDNNEIENYIEIINNIFTIENDLNLTLKNLFYVLHINDIETEITQSNSKFSMDYFNKYNGELFCIGNDYNNKNNLSISITKKNWLDDGPLHYFDSNKKVIDVCIFSKIRNEKFIKVENKSTEDSINYDIKIYDTELDTSLDTVEKQANNIYKHKHLILKLGYLNNGSYFIDSINDSSDSYSSINLLNNRTNFKLQKISNKKYEFYIYIIDQNGNKSYLNDNGDESYLNDNGDKTYLNDNGDKTSKPTTIWYIMPPGYVKDYYETSIITPSQLNNNKYYIKLVSGPHPTHTGYLAAQRKLDKDKRVDHGAYVMVHKDKNEASEWEIVNESNDESDDIFKIKCVGGEGTYEVKDQWLACHSYNSRDKRDHDSQGLMSAYMMTHYKDTDAAKFKIKNKELEIIANPDFELTVPGFVGCHDWYEKDRRTDKSVYLICWRNSLKNIFKFENVNEQVIVEESNDILVDKHYLNIKTYSSNNISISLENVINDNILPNNIDFKFIYNRPYIKVLVDNGIESKYLDKNGNLVANDNILSNHYLEIPYYNNPYIIVGSSNLNYNNNDIFKKNEHLVYIKNETINKYLNVLKHNKSDRTYITFKASSNKTEKNSNIEFDKYTEEHLNFINISQEISIKNPTLEECKAEALKNNNYNYIRYVTSERTPEKSLLKNFYSHNSSNLPTGWVDLREWNEDPDYDWYYTTDEKFSNVTDAIENGRDYRGHFNSVTEAQRYGNQECSRVYMGVMGSGEDWVKSNGSLCVEGWFSDRRGWYQKKTDNPAGCGYEGWNPGRVSETSNENKYTSGSGHIMCKVPKQRKSSCVLLEKCDNFNNDNLYTVFKKNPDTDDGFDEGIFGWCSSSNVNTQKTIENLYPDEFLWRLVYTGSLNKFRLINTEAPNIIIDNIEIIKKNDKYLFKKGSMYLSESNNVAKFNTSDENNGHIMNIIPYKKFTSNSFLNSKFKLNRQITNFSFTNSRITNETPYKPINDKEINLSLNRIFTFNINITSSVAPVTNKNITSSVAPVTNKNITASVAPVTNKNITSSISLDTFEIIIIDGSTNTFTGYLGCDSNDNRDADSKYVSVNKDKSIQTIWKIHKTHKTHKTEDDTFRLECIDGSTFDGGTTFTGWLGSHAWYNLENELSQIKEFDGDIRSRINTSNTYKKNVQDAINNIESVYMMNHKREGTASYFILNSDKTIQVVGNRDKAGFNGYLGCNTDINTDKKENKKSYYLMCHKDKNNAAKFEFKAIQTGGNTNNNNIFQTESFDGTVETLTSISPALSLYFNNINIKKKYNVFMSKKGINEYDLIGRYHLHENAVDPPINTNISKASFDRRNWVCNSTKCGGNLYIRDIDYHYDNITKNPTNVANYYDFKLIEEKILFSITENNSNNDKILLEKIVVSLSNNNLLVYSYLEPVNKTIRHSTTVAGGNYFYYKLHVNKKLENGVKNITLKLVPKNDGYSLLIMTNNKNTNSEGTKILDIIENINLHSLFTGTITDYNDPNFKINFKYLQYNSPRTSNIIRNGYNYKIKHKHSGKYLSLIRNKLTLDNNHRGEIYGRRFKINFIKVLNAESRHKDDRGKHFTYDVNKLDFRQFNERWTDTHYRGIRKKNVTVYNYTTKKGPFIITLWGHPHSPEYFTNKNPNEHHDNETNFSKNFKTGGARKGGKEEEEKCKKDPSLCYWSFNTNDILIFATQYSGATLKEQIENNIEDIDYEIKNYEDSSKTETCLVGENDLNINKNKIIVLDTDYRKNGGGGEIEGGYFNFHATTEQQNIFKISGGLDLYVYNPRHNNYYKINVKLNNKLNDSEKNVMSDVKYSSNILENKKPNAHGQLKIKITPDKFIPINVGSMAFEDAPVTKIVNLPEGVTEVNPRPINHMSLDVADKFNLKIVDNGGKKLHVQRNDTETKTIKCLYDPGHWGWGMNLNLNGIIPGKEKNLLEATQSEKSVYENISFDKSFEKDDVLIYYYDSNNLEDSFTNINKLREYVETNCLPTTSDISNKWSIIEENGKYKFYNDYFNTYLGENNIANYDNGVDFYTLQRGYKEKINNTDFTLEKTSDSSNYGIKNIENNRRIFGLFYGDESFDFNLKDSLYKSMITYSRSDLTDNASFEFIQETVNYEHEKTDYVTKRNIYNNNMYLPKTHYRYRIRNKLYNMYLGIDKTNTGKMSLDFTSSFDVIYINNNYIFYNHEIDKFLGENNIDIQLSIDPYYIKKIYQEEKDKLTLNSITVTKIYFKLENAFTNNSFYMKNIETGKYIVRTSEKSDKLLYYRFENLDPHFMYEFELIGETPFNTQQDIRNRLKDILPLTDY